MREAPIFSVVVPTHNRRRLLLRLLDALAKQSLPADQFEILLVHNYTDDGTAEAVAALAEEIGPELSYYRKNYPGPASSRQFGAVTARGRYIAFIDDDCVPDSNWLAAALEAFDGHSAIHSASIAPQAQNAQRLGLLQGKTMPMPEQPRRYLEKTILIDAPTLFYETCNIFYPKEVFDAVGGFSPEFLDKFYGEDTDLGWKVREAGYQVGFSEDCLVYHEVFQVSVWKWLKEPLFFVNLPYLARKFPAMREHMTLRYFLTAETGLYHLFLLGLLVSFASPLAGLLVMLPYFWQRYSSGKSIRNPLMRLARVVMGIPRGFLTWWALLRGSLKARSVLL